MRKRTSEKINIRLEAISTLKAAGKQWPEGHKNELIRQILERSVSELQEELFQLLLKRKKLKSPHRTKGLEAKQ